MVHVFIVNTGVSKPGFAQELRNILSEIPDLEYYVFSTYAPGHEAELAQTVVKTFDKEQIRIYSVGGNGTIRNIVNAVGLNERVEYAWLPTHASRFLQAIVDDAKPFADVKALVAGTAHPIDLIRANDMYLLNTFSIGIDSDLFQIANRTQSLGFLNRAIPYFLGLVHSLVFSPCDSFEVTLDDNRFYGKTTEIFFGNGCILGDGLHFSPDTCVTDGSAFYRILSEEYGKKRFDVVRALKTNNQAKLNRESFYGQTVNMQVERTDHKPFLVNVDGDLIEDTKFHVTLLHKKLHFVFPEGVTYE